MKKRRFKTLAEFEASELNEEQTRPKLWVSTGEMDKYLGETIDESLAVIGAVGITYKGWFFLNDTIIDIKDDSESKLKVGDIVTTRRLDELGVTCKILYIDYTLNIAIVYRSDNFGWILRKTHAEYSKITLPDPNTCCYNMLLSELYKVDNTCTGTYSIVENKTNPEQTIIKPSKIKLISTLTVKRRILI
jgi:uncharacterized protein YqfB (UPF0267 family)